MLAQSANDKGAASRTGQQSQTLVSASVQTTKVIPPSKSSPTKPPRKKWVNTTADNHPANKGKYSLPFQIMLVDFNGKDIPTKASGFQDGKLARKLLLVATLPEDYDVVTNMDAAKRRYAFWRYTYRVGHLVCAT